MWGRWNLYLTTTDWATMPERNDIMGAMKAYKNGLDMEADRLLVLVRSDLLLMGHGHTESLEFREAIATNLNALAQVLLAGGTPDPFPYFRHGDGATPDNALPKDGILRTCIAEGCDNGVPWDQGSDYCASCILADR